MRLLNCEDKLEDVLQDLILPTSGHGSLTENYNTIKKIFEARQDHCDFEAIYTEICTCLTFGLYQASITLTNHLLEKCLLLALIYTDALAKKEAKADLELNNYFLEETQKYFNYSLEKKIDCCFENNMITLEQKEILDKYRKTIRNGYSHSNPKKIFGDFSIESQIVKISEDKEFDLKSVNLDLWNSPIIQGLTQVMQSEKVAPDYFIFIDSIVRQLEKSYK